MSTVEGYDLHIYCDYDDGRVSTAGLCLKEHIHRFSGINKRDAYLQARAEGWLISTKTAPHGSMGGGNFSLCPTHVDKGHPMTNAQLKGMPKNFNTNQGINENG